MTKRQLRWRRVAATLGTAVLLAFVVLSQAPTTSVAQDGPKILVEKSARPSEVPESGSWVTYQVKVRNEGSEAVTLDRLVDDLYGDLADSGNTKISKSTCSQEAIQAGETYKCSFEAKAEGSAGSTVTDTVTVRVKDAQGKTAKASASAAVAIRSGGGGFDPKIAVEKSASPNELPEPGGKVTYLVKVRNEGPEAVEVTQMHDSLYGDLIVGANSLVHSTTCDLVTIQPKETYKCDFEAEAKGKAGDTVTDSVQVRVKDQAGGKGEASAQASVSIKGGHTPALKIRVEKSASPTEVQEPGGTVTYQVKVRNEGSDTVEVTQMYDNLYGDLIVGANSFVTTTTCELVRIKAGETYKCEFEAEAKGKAGDTVRDTVRVRVKDQAGGKAEASAEASVAVKGGSKPTLRIRVEKSASPTEVQEPGGTVTYRVKVRNEGSDTVEVTQMYDNLYGDLIVGANSLVSSTTCRLETIQPGTTYQCEFEANAEGQAGDTFTDTVRVRVKDRAGNKTEASDQATVAIKGGSKPTLKIRVEKSASPSEVLEPGQVVTYRVKVRNEGSEAVQVTQMQDNLYGDLLDGTNPSLDYTSCSQANINSGATHQCEFDAEVLGYAGTKVHDTVRVRVEDVAGNKTEASAKATVKIVSEVPDTGVPLPPPVIAGGLLALGAAAMGAGALVQSRGRKGR